MSAGRKSDTTGTPTRCAMIAPSPVCHVHFTSTAEIPRRRTLVIQRLPVASHQCALQLRSTLRRLHRLGVQLAQSKIQPRQISDLRRLRIHRLQYRSPHFRSDKGSDSVPATPAATGTRVPARAPVPRRFHPPTSRSSPPQQSLSDLRNRVPRSTTRAARRRAGSF